MIATVDLDNGEWELGDPLGKGGYGVVYRGHQGDREAAIKFIPKGHGPAREIELKIPEDARNVVPITGFGQDEENWIVSMPLAADTLENVLAQHGGKLPEQLALQVLSDVTEALISLDGRIIHRDIKPGNILLLDGKWCLSDFGIAKYAEAVTGTMTHKYAGSFHYVAPELWTTGTASSQSDMYALGIVAYQIITGRLPFDGTREQIQIGHLSETPAPTGAQSRLDWAIRECLAKAPELRLTAAQFANKLTPSQPSMPSKATEAMAAADQALKDKRDLAERQALQFRADAEERKAYLSFANERLTQIADVFLARLQSLSNEAELEGRHGLGWTLRLGSAKLTFGEMMHNPHWQLMESEDDPFTVMATAGLYLQQSASGGDYSGRSHSLWFADAEEAGHFQWYETAFAQVEGMVPLQRPVPFEAGFESAESQEALHCRGGYRVAWPFAPVDPDSLDEFADRWAVWLAEASLGRLIKPSAREAAIEARGSWRSTDRVPPVA
ncbi:serine/threonine protein kinase [Arthrobacter sp. Sa2BUA2]|uniref:Serine/threonine protein kinase n=1 Tax=Arthrobacter pullicola TaxID=2762224 RepID=A0ABR8YEH6_9MICC|nr:serine/threonine-protein kinase [Arthrobacter pullicola]MBD8042610.1 serine/threonine protein kinase [Arthrobacter pullicola]